MKIRSVAAVKAARGRERATLTDALAEVQRAIDENDQMIEKFCELVKLRQRCVKRRDGMFEILAKESRQVIDLADDLPSAMRRAREYDAKLATSEARHAEILAKRRQREADVVATRMRHAAAIRADAERAVAAERATKAKDDADAYAKQLELVAASIVMSTQAAKQLHAATAAPARRTGIIGKVVNKNIERDRAGRIVRVVEEHGILPGYDDA